MNFKETLINTSTIGRGTFNKTNYNITVLKEYLLNRAKRGETFCIITANHSEVKQQIQNDLKLLDLDYKAGSFTSRIEVSW